MYDEHCAHRFSLFPLQSQLTSASLEVAKHFPSALGVDDFLARVEMALAAYGFTGDNAIGEETRAQTVRVHAMGGCHCACMHTRVQVHTPWHACWLHTAACCTRHACVLPACSHVQPVP